MPPGLSALDRPGKLNSATVQQQFFRERGFAGIRMGNDGKRTSPANLLLDAGHDGVARLTAGRQSFDQNVRIFAAVCCLIVRGPLGHFVETFLAV